MMTRDLDRLTGRTFDVLVVGGGIYGLTIAYDAPLPKSLRSTSATESPTAGFVTCSRSI